jgi:LPS O-antigen subunit length determinant protein (WzzB/FepE family)
MKKSLDKNVDNNIDPVKIVINLWKIRNTIIIFSFFFTIIAYTYSALLPKKFQTYVILEKPSVMDFQNFKKMNANLIDSQNGSNGVASVDSFLDIGIYFDDFLNSIISGSSFKKFLIEYPEYKILGKALSEENITEWLSIEKYTTNKKNIPLAKIIFYHSEDLSLKAGTMLNAYIEFMKKSYMDTHIVSQISILTSQLEESEIILNEILKKNKADIKDKLLLLEIEKRVYLDEHERSIKNKIFSYKQALTTAKTSGIIEPLTNDDGITIEYGLFNLGTRVLSSEILNLNEQLNNLEKTETFNEIITKMEKYKLLEKTETFNEIIKVDERQNSINIPFVIKENTAQNIYQKLKEKISYKKAEIKYFKDINQIYKWNVILESAEKSKKIYPRKSLFAISGLFFGFIFSIIFMWFRSIVILK